VIVRRAVAGLGLLALAGCGGAAVAEQPTVASVAVRPAVLPAVPAGSAARPGVPAGCARTAVACVSTRHRLAWLQDQGRLTYGPVRVSLGGAGHRTPTGSFRVAWKDEEHTSSSYGISMPFSVFFAHGGIAFHEGPLDERSHGCVHLGPVAARAFFAGLVRGDRVQVF
jgi:lipoprotein-anchoring transpeptidase ErfK/SrfK